MTLTLLQRIALQRAIVAHRGGIWIRARWHGEYRPSEIVRERLEARS